MKLMRTVTLLYQYVYYWMLEIDRGKLSEMTSKYKAFLVFLAVETWMLGAFYIIGARMFGVGIHKIHLPIVVCLAYVFAMLYVNRWLLGYPKRTEHYKKILDGWDKWKRARWKLYVVFIAVSVFVLFMLVVQASRPMLRP